MGEPQEERLVWLHNEQAITLPNGLSMPLQVPATIPLFGVWGGENLKYSDKDEIKYTDMR